MKTSESNFNEVKFGFCFESFIKLSFLSLVLFSLVGCATKTANIDMHNDQGQAVMGLDYRDFQKAAGEAVSSMLQSGAVNKRGGGRYILAISRVVNDTMQRIDVRQLIKKIRVQLLQSGKVVVTTAVGGSGPEDHMAMQARQLRASDEFNQKTVAKKGQMIAPDLSLSGRIIQRVVKIDSSTQQSEYYFQLTLTDINTGLAFWEGETVIGKRGSSNSVAW
jgi:penicillin-binding protein activator